MDTLYDANFPQLGKREEGRWLQNRVQSTKANDPFHSKDSLTDFFRNLGEYDSLDSVNTKVRMTFVRLIE